LAVFGGSLSGFGGFQMREWQQNSNPGGFHVAQISHTHRVDFVFTRRLRQPRADANARTSDSNRDSNRDGNGNGIANRDRNGDSANRYANS